MNVFSSRRGLRGFVAVSAFAVISAGLAVSPTVASQGPSSQTNAVDPVAKDTDHDRTFDALNAADAAAAAKSVGEPVEDLSQRTESTSVLANSDGTWTSKDFGGPIRIKRDGTWIPVDYNLVKKSDGSWVPKASPVDVSIDGGSAKEAARVTFDDGESLAVTWPKDLPDPTVHGGVATYKLSDASDLVVAVTGEGVTTRLRLNEQPAADDPVFTFGLRTDSIDLSEADGGVKAESEDGDKLGGISTLVAWDAKVDAAGDPVEVVPLDSTLTTVSSAGDVTKHDLGLTTPEGYLSDPDRSYPVTIDPDISGIDTLRDMWARANDTVDHASDYRLVSGRYNTSSNTSAAMSYVQFDNSQVASKDIISATASLWQYSAATCADKRMMVNPISSSWGVHDGWADRPSVRSTETTYVDANHGGGSACADAWVNLDVTEMAKKWAAGTYPNYGIRLSSTGGSDATFDRRFCSRNPDTSTACNTATHRPYLSFTYNWYPNTPTNPTESVTEASPTLSATVTDPGGQPARARFQIAKLGTVVFDGYSDYVPSGSRASITIDPLTLGDYTYKVWANNKTFSSKVPSAARSFSVTSVVGGSYETLPSTVLVDTSATGGTPFGPGETREYNLLENEDFPNSNVSAVAVNVTASTATTTSTVQMWAGTDTAPTASLLQFSPGHLPVSNAAIVKVGTDGKIKIKNSSGTTNLTVSVTGYFTLTSTSTSTGGYIPARLTRVVNTVDGTGTPVGKLAAGTSITAHVPASLVPVGAKAVFANVTLLGSTGSGSARTGPGGSDLSGAAGSFAFNPGSATSVSQAIPLNANGEIQVRLNPGSSPADVQIDVQGYFADDVSDETGLFRPLDQKFYFDTHGSVALAPGETRSIKVAGNGGVPLKDAGVVASTLTVSGWHSNGGLEIFGDDTDPTEQPTIQFSGAEAVTNPEKSTTVFVDLSPDGKAAIKNESADTVEVTLAAQGWFYFYDQESSSDDIGEEDVLPDETVPDPEPGTSLSLEITDNGLHGAENSAELSASDLADPIAPVQTQFTAQLATSSIGASILENWPPCYKWSAKTKKLRSYYRYKANYRQTGTTAWVYCGTQTKSGKKSWGQRHIAAQHQKDWKTIAKKAGFKEGQWEAVASFVISRSLGAPLEVYTNANNYGDTWCYSAALNIIKDGHTVKTYYPRTYVGATGRKVITTFPVTNGCNGSKVY